MNKFKNLSMGSGAELINKFKNLSMKADEATSQHPKELVGVHTVSPARCLLKTFKFAGVCLALWEGDYLLNIISAYVSRHFPMHRLQN